MNVEHYQAARIEERKAWAAYTASITADYRQDRGKRGHSYGGNGTEVPASPVSRALGARWQAAYRERNRLAPWACAR